MAKIIKSKIIKKVFLPIALNALILIALFFLGRQILFDRNFLGFSVSPDDASSGATIFGAILGTGAIFIGNLITTTFNVLEKENELEDFRNSVRKIVLAEIYTIFIPHIKEASSLSDYWNFYNQAWSLKDISKPHMSFCVHNSLLPINKLYRVAETKLINSSLKEMLTLPTDEVSAIIKMHQSIEKTRCFINFLLVDKLEFNSNKEHKLSFQDFWIEKTEFLTLKEYFFADCKLACDVIDAMSQNTQVSIYEQDNGEGIKLPLKEFLLNPEKMRDFTVLAEEKRDNLQRDLQPKKTAEQEIREIWGGGF